MTKVSITVAHTRSQKPAYSSSDDSEEKFTGVLKLGSLILELAAGHHRRRDRGTHGIGAHRFGWRRILLRFLAFFIGLLLTFGHDELLSCGDRSEERRVGKE